MLKKFPFTLFVIIIVVQLGVLSVQIFGGSRSPEDSPAIKTSLCAAGLGAGCADEHNSDGVPGKVGLRPEQLGHSPDPVLGQKGSVINFDNEQLVQEALISAVSHHLDRALLRMDSPAGRFRVASGQNLQIRPVPEPSSALTIGGGCVALALFARRRRAGV